jgi:hypothetical protein
MAAAEALTVSEAALQRIKQQGCGTTRQDRSLMQLPDLKALTHPISTNAPVEVSAGPNNMFMGRASVQAEGFVPPFVDEALETGQTPSPAPVSFSQQVTSASAGSRAIPGLAFAGTGDIAQLDEVMLGDPPVLYKQIAASIRGEALPSKKANSAPQVLRDPPAPLGGAGVPSFDAAEEGRALERRLYGSGRAGERGSEAQSFWQSCGTACRGFLYDLLHLQEVQKVYGAAGGVSALHVATTRDGRTPYLVFILLLLALAAVVLWLLTQAAEIPQGYPGFVHYPLACPSTAAATTGILGPLCGLPYHTQ